ncbi:MAG TPA: prepilin peptidase [Symbiobacteriaceae bacterium]|nr:prepilin peptidase [Symbiobacteriaceae bacterium]
MSEVWSVLGAAPPLLVMLALLLLGLVFGSFGYATHFRLAARGGPRGPRSCCPACGHTLGALDLTPLVGYFWLRGRCRHCQVRISPAYPLAEAAVGLLASIGGYFGGWLGGAAAIGAAVAVLIGAGVWRRRRGSGLPAGSPGVALLENLVAIALITIISAPVLNVVVHAMASGNAAQERTVMTGLARQRMNELESAARLQGKAAWINECTNGRQVEQIAGYMVELAEPAVTECDPPPSGDPWSASLIRVTLNVRLTCAPQCKEKYGAEKPTVQLTSSLWAK